MSDRLATTLAEIDAANGADPTKSTGGVAAALLYGQRMSEELALHFPQASDLLQIAARGQHIERWKLARTAYPEGRAGYLAWRRAQAVAHAKRVGEIMARAGYSAEDQDRVGVMMRKEGLKRDEEVQALEDVICMVFLRWYFADFAEGRDPEKVRQIVVKTARKMSPEGRSLATATFALPDDLAAAFSPS